MKRFLLLAAWVAAATFAQDTATLQRITRVKTEAFDHSKVMEHLWYLTDVNGPRLTASPEYRQAAEWVVKRLNEYGVANVHLEKWPFGRSWSLEEFSAEMTQPRYARLTASPLAWSASTNGPVDGDIIVAPMGERTWDLKKAEEQFSAYQKKWAGRLRGKIVLLGAAKPPKPQTSEAFKRYTDTELAERAAAPEPNTVPDVTFEDLKFPEDHEELMAFLRRLPDAVLMKLWDARQALQTKYTRFFREEGALALVEPDQRAHGGLTFAEGAGSYKPTDPLALPTFAVTAEDFDRIVRLTDKNVPVKLRLNLSARMPEEKTDALNVVGEIPGTGPHKDEIIMIGAHLDSWHAGTGATDNGAGSAVMIEVMRILKTLDLKLDRTVRIGLWAGEEEGLLGSREYVKEHFGDPQTMKLTSQHAKLSGYFNLDNGSGKIRGVYLQGNDAMRPLFEQWLAPFRDLGVTTVTLRNTGGTDHLSFDAVGLPGFQFIQDPLDYMSVTHHSDMDTYDHAVAADLMQASAIITTVVADAANLPEMLPRKPLPRPAQ